MTAFGTATALALAISWVIQRQFDAWNHRSDGDFLTDALAAATYGFTFHYAFEALAGTRLDDPNWVTVAAVALGGLAWFIVRALVAAFVGVERTDLAGRYLWLLALEDWAVVISVLAAGTLFGLTWPVMGVWSFAVAVLPYAFGHLAFERYHSTRVTYGQTIRALAQIPDVAGLAPRGHSTRTADLAVAVAQELAEMHLDSEAICAAILHDVVEDTSATLEEIENKKI